MSTGESQDSYSVQLYDTTVVDPAAELAVRVLVIPKRSISDPKALNSWTELALRLGLEILDRTDNGSVVPIALTSMLLEENIDSARDRFQMLLREQGTGVVQVRPYRLQPERLQALLREQGPASPARVEHFIKNLTSGSLIPFEESPLGAISLSSIASKVATGGVGAVIGWAVAGPTPLLFLTVPAGIILCGAAGPVGRALGVGLAYRILRLMGLSDGQALKVAQGATRSAASAR